MRLIDSFPKMADIELKNETDLKFEDISMELERTYHFPVLFKNGKFKEKDAKHTHLFITIHEPQWLSVSESGGHRVVNKNGRCFYIPSWWYFLDWKPKDGASHFVK